MRELIRITKALSDENRLRIIAMLRNEEHCACDIIEVLGLAPSTVSRHLTLLDVAGLVQVRKAGRWRHYRLTKTSTASQPVRRALSFIRCTAFESDQCIADLKTLKNICCKKKEDCK